MSIKIKQVQIEHGLTDEQTLKQRLNDIEDSLIPITKVDYTETYILTEEAFDKIYLQKTYFPHLGKITLYRNGVEQMEGSFRIVDDKTIQLANTYLSPLIYPELITVNYAIPYSDL